MSASKIQTKDTSGKSNPSLNKLIPINTSNIPTRNINLHPLFATHCTLDGKINNDDVPPVARPVDKGFQTPPSIAAGFFGGVERASRSISSHDAAINDRREEGEGASTAAAEQNMEDGGAESSDTAAAVHLREPAIVQMAELGLPRQWAELALSQVGGTNIEACAFLSGESG